MNDTNSYYDKECMEQYGKKTCIIIKEITIPQSMHNKAELRFLDKNGTFLTTQVHLADIIPNLLSYNYYVIIVDKTSHSQNITAIHCPCKS